MLTESVRIFVSIAMVVVVPVLVASMLLEISLQHFWIARMRKLKIKQVTKLYGPSWHEKTKTGTPTMGGVVFLPVLLLILLAVHLANPASLTLSEICRLISYPLLAASVGFIDDWVKHSRGASDGISSLQKLALQIAVTLPWAIWILPGGLPLMAGVVVPRYLGIALLTFTGVGFQNAVNVTDGLDGLATGCALISFIAAVFFLPPRFATMAATVASCGICLGFLWHNANPAVVFMGDVGAHFIAALLLTLCVLTDSFIYIVPFGFMFGVEIVSVAIQIVAIRRFKRKVFRMSPIHHHFEMVGWSETQVVARFYILHFIGLLITMQVLFLFRTLA